jgi:ribosomal protein L12E/L44/L45/RPP1/RPP2
MSSSKTTEAGKESKKSSKEHKTSSRKKKESTEEVDDDEEVIDLCDDHDYQVLSAVFETDSGRNIADILSRLQKDVHLLAMSVHQLIQLSLASHSARKNNSDEDDEDDEEEQGSDDENDNEDVDKPDVSSKQIN